MTNKTYYIAQINIARLKYPLEDPRVAEFVNNLDRINSLAEHAPGFVWRLKDESGNATSIKGFEDDKIIVNMSVWETIDQLFAFTYRSDHVDIFRKRGEWFENKDFVHLALWWIPAGIIPTIEEAREKLELLKSKGPSQEAFTFKKSFSHQN